MRLPVAIRMMQTYQKENKFSGILYVTVAKPTFIVKNWEEKLGSRWEEKVIAWVTLP